MAARRSDPPSSVTGDAVPSASKAVLVYNACRLVLLAACLGLGYLAGLRGILLIVVALLVSGLLSWYVLAKQRIGMGRAIEQTVERGRVRMAVRTTAEDAYAETMMASAPPPAIDVEPESDPPAQIGEQPTS